MVAAAPAVRDTPEQRLWPVCAGEAQGHSFLRSWKFGSGQRAFFRRREVPPHLAISL